MHLNRKRRVTEHLTISNITVQHDVFISVSPSLHTNTQQACDLTDYCPGQEKTINYQKIIISHEISYLVLLKCFHLLALEFTISVDLLQLRLC